MCTYISLDASEMIIRGAGEMKTLNTSEMNVLNTDKRIFYYFFRSFPLNHVYLT